MSTFRDKVDHFLFNFSYSIKIKSIILLSAFTAIFIAIMLILTQHRLLSSVGKQEFGIQYQREINTLLEKVLLYKVVNSEKNNSALIKADTNDVSNQLQVISDYNQNAATTIFDLESPVIEQLRFHYSTIEHEWQLIQNGNDSYYVIIEEIRLLSREVDSAFSLSLNIDPGMHYLTDILINQIPTIEIIGAQISTMKALWLPEEQKSLKDIAKIIVRSDALSHNLLQLEDNLFLAQKYNETVAQSFTDPTIQTTIAEYLQGYKILLQLIPNKNTSTSPESLTSQEIKCLELSASLNNEITKQTLSLIQIQSGTLMLRENYGLGFVIFGTIIILAAYTTRIIRRPLAIIRSAAEELERGNKGVRIEVYANDEVGQICESFNQLAEQIEKIIHDIDGISGNLATSSHAIFTTAQHLESNVIRQENAITQIASNAKGVSRTVQEFARSLQEVSQSSMVTAHLADLGRTSLIEMERIMHQMAKASMSIVKTLSDLQDKIGTINNVINTIVLIADQINLLSLNTAIRAGKPGIKHLGFSIVADKISELADQTALATLDIEELVEKIITMVSDSVQVVDNFSDQIRNQVFEASEIGEGLKKLISQTQNQFEAFEMINQKMQLQTKRAQQIHESINLLTEVAQNTTHSVRNLYLEIQYLHHSTNNLRTMTKKLMEDKQPGFMHL